jgi:hypothetical protein
MPLDPTISVVFPLFALSGAPATGITPTFSTYESLAGAPITQPTIVEIGNGFYGFQPGPTDIANGTVYIIDGTTACNPRYQAGALQPGADVSADVTEVLALCTLMANVLTGRWEIVTSGMNANQMIFYGPDNTTVIATFNLLDINGNPAFSGIYQRTVA